MGLYRKLYFASADEFWQQWAGNAFCSSALCSNAFRSNAQRAGNAIYAGLWQQRKFQAFRQRQRGRFSPWAQKFCFRKWQQFLASVFLYTDQWKNLSPWQLEANRIWMAAGC